MTTETHKNSDKLKEMILTIKQERKEIKADQDILKDKKDRLKELEDEFMSLALQEFTKSDDRS